MRKVKLAETNSLVSEEAGIQQAKGNTKYEPSTISAPRAGQWKRKRGEGNEAHQLGTSLESWLRLFYALKHCNT